jgi:hypothetical protein
VNDFFINVPALGPGVYPAFNRNEYSELQDAIYKNKKKNP